MPFASGSGCGMPGGNPGEGGSMVAGQAGLCRFLAGGSRGDACLI